jgi:hypothetical protein
MNKFTFLIATALLCFTASAEAKNVAQLGNKGGGYITLTDVQGECATGSLRSFSNTDTGKTIFGCWTTDTERRLVLIQWNGRDDVNVYRGDNFTLLAGARKG